ncbi:MAG TPA: SpoIID/LytB domain-containing protein [Verrucomicrobiae bacterium]|nr:SpoIID/LytB domain-containing protein [Verrucomicrobiae bacterium]
MLSFFAYPFLFLAVSLWPFSSAPKPEIKKSSMVIPADLSQISHIRILVVENASSVKVNTVSPYQVWDGEGHKLFSGTKIVATTLRPAARGIQMGKQILPAHTVRIELTGGGEISVGDGRYAHAISVVRNPDGKLDVINEAPVEEYLKGVLPKEVSARWPPETLKAQAVAARTYALFKAIENKDEPYDVEADVKSQVYGGRHSEHPITNQAVEDTRGEVMTYQGKLFPGFFHSTCGGHTTRADAVWPIEKHPVLMGVACRFCQGSKHYRWSQKFTTAEIDAALKKMGFAISGLMNVAAVDFDTSGRADNFLIKYRFGQRKISAVDFRMFMGSYKFKSTIIKSIEPVEGGFVFKGRGWGHGVGLCQYGSKQLADLGYTYKQILDYYYPGQVLKHLDL